MQLVLLTGGFVDVALKHTIRKAISVYIHFCNTVCKKF